MIIEKFDLNIDDKNALEIVEKLKKHGGNAYYVGGIVRDSIIGFEDSHDIDISTNLTPDIVRFVLGNFRDQRKKITVIEKGVKFGTITVNCNGFEYDISTFRKEIYGNVGNKPISVEFSNDIEDDAFRRDLTINALYYDPVEKTVYDPTGFGLLDIKQNVLRVPGKDYEDIKNILISDVARILRISRFSSKLGFEVDGETLKIMKDISGDVDFLDSEIISKERIIEELSKILMTENPSRSFLLLQRIGALKSIIGIVSRLLEIEQDNVNHPEGDAFTHTMAVIDAVHDENIFNELLQTKIKLITGTSEEIFYNKKALLWAALMHDVGKYDEGKVLTGIYSYKHGGHEEKSFEILKSFFNFFGSAFSNEIKDEVMWLVKNHGTPITSIWEKLDNYKKYEIMSNKYFGDLIILRRADVAGGKDTNIKDFEAWFSYLESIDSEMKNQFLKFDYVAGEEITPFFPSEMRGKALSFIKKNYFEGKYMNKEEAIMDSIIKFRPHGIGGNEIKERFFLPLEVFAEIAGLDIPEGRNGKELISLGEALEIFKRIKVIGSKRNQSAKKLGQLIKDVQENVDREYFENIKKHSEIANILEKVRIRYWGYQPKIL